VESEDESVMRLRGKNEKRTPCGALFYAAAGHKTRRCR
jgi:hypothetical protein